MAASKAVYSPTMSPRFTASTRSPQTCRAPLATVRGDLGTSRRRWGMGAKNRWSAAAAIAAHIHPSTRAGLAVLAQGRDDVRMPPRFGPDEPEAARILDAAPRVQVERATLRQPHTGSP